MSMAKLSFALLQLMVFTGALAQSTTPTRPLRSLPETAATPSGAQLPSTQVTPSVAAQLRFDKLVRRGGESGGGGSYVLIDGEVMISDRFYDSVGVIQPTPVRQVTFAQLPPAVRRGAIGLVNLFQRALKAKRGENQAITKIYDGQYFLVPKGLENQAFCNNYLPNLNRQVDEHFRFGCTNGNVTFLFVDAFERPEVGLREQVYALLHERLWTLAPGIDQQVIADFTTALHDLEDLSMKQESTSSDAVSAEQSSALVRLQKAARGLGYSTLNIGDYNVAASGALVHKQCGKVDLSDTLVTAGSRIECIPGKTPLLKNSRIIRSLLKETGTIVNSSVSDSLVQVTGDYDDQKLEARDIRWLSKIPYSITDSTVADSVLNGMDLQNAQIDNVSMERRLYVKSSQVTDSRFSGNASVRVGENSRLANIRTKVYTQTDFDDSTSANLEFKPSTRLNGLVIETQIQSVRQVFGRPVLFGVEVAPPGTLRRANLRSYTDSNGNSIEVAVDPSVEITKGPIL